MIESLKDLELDKIDLKAENYLELVENVFKEKLGVSFTDVRLPLIDFVKSHAEELSLMFPNIAPHGDYSKLIEDNDGMADFLKSLEKVDDWKILSVDEEPKYNLLKFSFVSTAVDDGESLEGFTYVSKDGKIKHCFAQYSG
jgi:hypothetical protein